MAEAEAKGYDPIASVPSGAPKSVYACVTNAWTFTTFDSLTGEVRHDPFRCKSYRCPQCRYQVARADYARMFEALSNRVDMRNCVVITLTFNPAKCRTIYDAFKKAGRCWQKLQQRLERYYGHWKNPAKLRRLQVWERHASGWPHVHMVVESPELCEDIRRRGPCNKEEHRWGPTRWDGRIKRRVPNWAWKPDVLDVMAQACGFGEVSDVQFPRAKEGGLAGYFCKLTGELVGCFDQRPANAPPHFRRLRASRGFLPPRTPPSGRYGGLVVQTPHARVAAADPRSWQVPLPTFMRLALRAERYRASAEFFDRHLREFQEASAARWLDALEAARAPKSERPARDERPGFYLIWHKGAEYWIPRAQECASKRLEPCSEWPPGQSASP